MRTFFVGAVFLFTVAAGWAYDFIGSPPIRWPAGPVPVVIQLDHTRAPKLLRDGKTSWDAVAAEAFSLWNGALSDIQFTTRPGTGVEDGNERNEIAFSDTVFGRQFGSGVLAVTTVWRIGDTRVEGDTLFNQRFDWNSYRSDLRGEELDLRRVALHEFGHIIGLDHPDEEGQIVSAVMNSRITDLDHLTDDDIRGARALYGDVAEQFSIATAVFPPGAGTIIVSPSSPSGLYSAGTLVKVIARPTKGYRFNFWTGLDPLPGKGGQTLKFRVFEDVDFTANFNSNSAPRIATHPRSAVAASGQAATFQVRAGNRVTYQWQFQGSNIPGATAPMLILENVDQSDAGFYSVIVTGSRGQTISRPARLIVDGI